jgi:hypothetical protein
VPAATFKIDFKRSEVLIPGQDGTQIHKALPFAPPGKVAFEFAEFDPRRNVVEFVHENGTRVSAEIEPLGSSAPLAPNRPVLYLDQCHWITLARQLWAPEKVLERERDAAVELIGMARAGEVILPISSANLSEMTPADGAFRRNLGLTMLQLSRGWQMRNPVHVRGMELRALFAGEEPVASNVFTLAPGVLFIGETPLAPPPPRDPIAALGQRISEVFAIYQVAVEDEKIPNPEGLEKAEAWAQEQRRFALLLREDGVSAGKAHHYAAVRLVHDLAEEVLAAARWSGISETEIKVWLEEKLDDGVSKMPLLGTFHRTVYDRVRNAEAKWEANHFNDIQFLSCAAAYADIVVGEKETSEHLKRAQRGHRGAAICRTLPEAIACLTGRVEVAWPTALAPGDV